MSEIILRIYRGSKPPPVAEAQYKAIEPITLRQHRIYQELPIFLFPHLPRTTVTMLSISFQIPALEICFSDLLRILPISCSMMPSWLENCLYYRKIPILDSLKA